MEDKRPTDPAQGSPADSPPSPPPARVRAQHKGLTATAVAACALGWPSVRGSVQLLLTHSPSVISGVTAEAHGGYVTCLSSHSWDRQSRVPVAGELVSSSDSFE